MFNKSVNWLLVLGLVVGLTTQLKSESDNSKKTKKSKQFDHEYTDFANVLNRYVTDDGVKYAALKQNRGRLDQFITSLEDVEISKGTKQQRLAFYINAYNAITLRSIIDAYPIKSIKDIDGVWVDKKWLVAGQKITLNDIEHKILRKEFDEPRIHVAVNCASIGCPQLATTPFLPNQLEKQLQQASVKFAQSAIHNVIDEKNGEAKISAIFDWFGDDFIDKYYQENNFQGMSKKLNASMGFLAAHLSKDRAAVITKTEFDLEFKEYNWALNEVK